MKINTKEKYHEFLKRFKFSSKREALPLGKKKHRKIVKRKIKVRNKSGKGLEQKTYTLLDIWNLTKKMRKLEKRYDEAEGRPLTQARIEKSAMSVQAILDALQ